MARKRKTEPERTYLWRGRSYKTKPDEAEAEFRRIRHDRGELTASALVDESRPEEAVCHNDFEWDDSVAGEQFRLVQARTMLRALEVRVEKQDPRAVNVRVKIADQAEGKYETMETVVEDVDLFASAIANLESKMQAATKAAADLHNVANNSPEHKDKLAVIAMAVKACEAASRAVSVLAK